MQRQTTDVSHSVRSPFVSEGSSHFDEIEIQLPKINLLKVRISDPHTSEPSKGPRNGRASLLRKASIKDPAVKPTLEEAPPVLTEATEEMDLGTIVSSVVARNRPSVDGGSESDESLHTSPRKNSAGSVTSTKRRSTVQPGEAELATGTFFTGKARISMFQQQALRDAANKRVSVIPEKANAPPLHPLAALPFFASKSSDFIEEMLCSYDQVHVHAGQLLFEQGTPGSSLVFLAEGMVSVNDGKVTVDHVSAGGYFGDANFFGVTALWQFTFVAELPCLLYVLGKDAVRSICRHLSPDDDMWPESIRDMCHFAYNTYQGDYHINTLPQNMSRACCACDGFSDKLLYKLGKAAILKLYFPGQLLIKQGDQYTDLFLLEWGRVRVTIAGREVNTVTADEKSPPSAFGEMAFIGLSKSRNASVEALSPCLVRVLYQSIFVSLLQESGETLSTKVITDFMAANSDKSKRKSIDGGGNSMKKVKLFRDAGCSDDFLHFLEDHLEEHVFLDGHRVVEEGAEGSSSMFFVSYGSCRVIKDGRQIGVLTVGSSFGHLVALGMAEARTATVVCAEPCYVEELHQSVVMRALELFPLDRDRVLTMANQTSWAKVGGKETLHNMMSVLREFPFFKSWGQEVIESMDRGSRNRMFLPQEYIVREGDAGDSMFVLVLGTATMLVGCEASEESRSCSKESLPSGGRDGHEQQRHGDEAAGKDRGGVHGEASTEAAQVLQVQRSTTPRSGSKSTPRSVSKSSTQKSQEAVKRMMGKADETDIVVNAAGFFKRARVIKTLRVGDVFGELAMMGVVRCRSASVRADTLCSLWEVPYQALAEAFRLSDNCRQQIRRIVCENLEHTVPPRIMGLSLFKDFDQSVRIRLAFACRRAVFFPEQTIADTDAAAAGLCFMNVGEAAIIAGKIVVGMLKAGNYFGVTVMLGMHKQFIAKLWATDVCHVFIISHEIYKNVLKEYPSPSADGALRKSQAIILEETKRTIRCARFENQMLTNFAASLEDKPVQVHRLMLRALQGWRQVRDAYKNRRARVHALEKQQRQVETWIHNHREEVRQRSEMEKQVKESRLGFVREDCSPRSVPSQPAPRLRAGSPPPKCVTPSIGDPSVDGYQMHELTSDGVSPTMGWDTSPAPRLPRCPRIVMYHKEGVTLSREVDLSAAKSPRNKFAPYAKSGLDDGLGDVCHSENPTVEIDADDRRTLPLRGESPVWGASPRGERWREERPRRRQRSKNPARCTAQAPRFRDPLFYLPLLDPP